MTETAGAPLPASVDTEITVNVADLAAASGRRVIVTSGLGSCVAVILYDHRTHVAGLAHVLLPDTSIARANEHRAKFAPTAVPALVDEMRGIGAAGPFTAKITGGSSMFGALLTTGVNMGERNIEACRQALAAAHIPIVAEDVGGDHGRTVYVDVATGRVRVHSLNRGDCVL